MKYPRHLAIIADGNRTWAKEQGLPTVDGHFAGAKKTLEMMEHIFTTTPIDVLTGWFLSTENLKNRSKEEVSAIFALLKALGNDMDPFLSQHHINFRWVGNREGMPEDVVAFLDTKAQTFTFSDSPKTCVFALNYGGRDEIIRGIQSLTNEEKDNITEESFAKHLDFGNLAPLDMVIRTKGDVAHRTSGFMSRWIGYAELYFSKEYYPGMTTQKIDEALHRYDTVAEDRNFGK